MNPVIKKLYQTPAGKTAKKMLYDPVRDLYEKRTRFDYLDRIFPDIYRRAVSEGGPVQENKVLFVDEQYDYITDSFRLIYDRLKADPSCDVHVHYLRRPFVSRREFNRRCIKMLKDMATAKYVFLDAGSQVISCIPKRPETIVVQLWHACGAFKKFGFSTALLRFGESPDILKKYGYYRNLNYVTVSSPEVVWAYAEAMGLKGQEDIIRPVGVSRTDLFYDQSVLKAARARLDRLFPAAKGKKVILFAPTFRGRVSDAKTVTCLDYTKLREALCDKYVLVTKHHPLVKQIPKLPEDCAETFACDATGSMSIEELLMAADICISDYSSLIFEYSLMERPMIFFAYDLEDYFDDRGFYYNYGEMTPGPVCRTTGEIIDYIRHIDELFDPRQVKDFREKFMSSCDGHSTDRILEMVFGTVSGGTGL